MASAKALQIARIELTVGDLEAARGFYVDALGFSAVEGERGLLRLGGQTLALTVAKPPGRPYPQARAANDPWFQHFAIVVADMGEAYRRLCAHPSQAISRGGPQLLPPSTGSVTAYKFRDPDGHPLELSHIPGGAWTAMRRGPGDSPFLGIDHSALAVCDLEASLAFYCDLLGFSLGGRGLNRGPEQDRLDGLDGVEVEIVSLTTADPGPHIELLHYRSPPTAAAPLRAAPQDVAATRLVVKVEDADATMARLAAAGLDRADPGRELVRDPDGHLLEIVAA